LLFASFPGGKAPSSFWSEGFIFKNSLLREHFSLVSPLSFIRGNISVAALDLFSLEVLSFKEAAAFKTFLQK